MGISDWPAAERPREKLLAKGAAKLSDAELLAIFLRTGVSGRTAVDLARDLLAGFGGLRPLLEASTQEFAGHHGLGPAKYAQLQAVLEMARRHLQACLEPGESLAGPEDTRRYLTSRLRHLPHEVFACLFLDNRHQMVGFEELFRGTIDSTSVYPREVVRRALDYNAAAVIFAHNHPSGVTEPSRADELMTQRLIEALGIIDIRVVDHFIVGEGRPVSFAERGLL
ncbi:MAG: DNA repair protein RadC [Spiribacter sp.]|jgi:DNA repair protein RadC|nr:DNA repair protein RadC [Spiribacter sp.]MDR9488753.1 DNA repair protein RadC [Spiribacter sp.]